MHALPSYNVKKMERQFSQTPYPYGEENEEIMKRRAKSCYIKTIITLGIVILLAGSILRCAPRPGMPQSPQEADREGGGINGSLTMAGSTSMEKLANAAAEGMMRKYPDLSVAVEFTGSSAGIQAVLSGRADIGNSSRELREEEKASGAVENIVAIDGIAVVTDTGNSVTGLTTEQLIGIYKGGIRNWKDVGGADEAIVVVGREAGSGTREAFEGFLGIKDACDYANELDSTGAVMARVMSTPGAIGYVSFDVLDGKVSALSIDNAEPTEENVRSGSYTFCRPFVMVTRGGLSEQSEAVQALFSYLQSDEGKELIRSVGLILPE